MDQSIFIQKQRFKVATFGQQGTSASNRYLDHNSSYFTETVAGRATDDSDGYCCSAPTVPDPPVLVSVTALRGAPGNGPSASLVFTQGSDGKSPITNYLYTTDGVMVSSPVYGPSPILVTDLSYGTTYFFALKAENRIGESGSSNTIVFYMPTLPDPPTITSATADVSSATINFTPGYDGSANIINYWYSFDNITFIPRTPAATSSPLIITGLTINTTYTIYIIAENVLGVGDGSTSVTVSTTSNAPRLTSAIPDASSAYVYFVAGTGTIVNYKWSTNNGTSFTVRTPASILSPIRVTGLTNGQLTTIYLQAIFSDTTVSPLSNSITVTPTNTPSPVSPTLYYDTSGYDSSGFMRNLGSGPADVSGTLGANINYIPGIASGIFDVNAPLAAGSDLSYSIAFPQYNFGTAISVCVWFYPRVAVPGTNNINTIFANGSPGLYTCGFKMGWDFYSGDNTIDNRAIYFEAGRGGATPADGGSNSTVDDSFPYYTWQHITYVFDQANGSIAFYINGLPASMATDNTTVAEICMDQPFLIGGLLGDGTVPGGTFGMNAQFASLKVFPYVMNPIDIYNDYTTTKSRFIIPATTPTLNVAVPADSSAYIYFTAGTGTFTNYEWSTDGINFTPFSPATTSSPVLVPGLTNGITSTIYLRAVILGGGTSAASFPLQVTPTGTPTLLDAALLYDAANYSGSGPVLNSAVGGPVVSGTLVADVSYNSSIVGGIFNFPGNGYINFGTYNFGNYVTICAWIYPRAKGSLNGLIATGTSGGGSTNGFKLGWNNYSSSGASDRAICSEMANGSTMNKPSTVGGIITLSTWQHIAYVFDKTANTIIFYKNGMPQTVTGVLCPPNVRTNFNFKIGSLVDGSYGMNAQLASLKVFSAIFNATDIYNDYDTTKSRFGL